MLERLNGFIWGAPALLLILGVGIYFTVRSGFVQISLFGRAAKTFFAQLSGMNRGSNNSPYRALCTALAATVGTGNIIGVAGAIVIGGPGSIFWMWICGFLGMMIKFAEATLAVRYCTKNEAGEFIGGPMHMITNGMGKGFSWLAAIYCVFCVAASFGVGNAAQVNAVVESINPLLGNVIEGKYLIGVALGVLVASVLIGGAKRIGHLIEYLVPFSACAYLVLCLMVFICKGDRIPSAAQMIFQGAISPKAVTGGVLGSAFQAMTVGASRGTFTNEAGMGTASIAHATAAVHHPVEQGLMGMCEVFIDTIVICTMTALVILCSGVNIPYGEAHGATLTVDAFANALGNWVQIPFAVIVCSFAVATIFGWSFYGIRCVQFLTGERAWKGYVVLQVVIVSVSAMINTKAIWSFSELMNGLMVIPNLFALLCISPELLRLISDYKGHNKYSAVNLTKMYKKW